MPFWQKGHSQISDSKVIFEMKGMQQIAGKINTNIFQYEIGKILKLVGIMSKEYKTLRDLQ